MGCATWASLPAPLPGRRNLVVTHHPAAAAVCHPGALAYGNWAMIQRLSTPAQTPHVWIIGGASIYAYALQALMCPWLYLTEIDAAFPQADTWWPVPEVEWVRGMMYAPAPAGGPGAIRQTWRRALAGPWQGAHPLRYRFTAWCQEVPRGA
jgi:dihydrofolate reductase